MVYRDGKKIDTEELESDKDSGNQTTLIPKSLLPEGVKVGDEIRLKIVHGFEDELEVSYSSKEKKDKDKADNSTQEPKSEDMDQANSDLDALATQ